MNSQDTRIAIQPHYLLLVKLYIKPDGGVLVTLGNQRMEATHEEVQALLLGLLDYAQVFARLHTTIDKATAEVIKMNGHQLTDVTV